MLVALAARRRACLAASAVALALAALVRVLVALAARRRACLAASAVLRLLLVASNFPLDNKTRHRA